MSTEYEPSDREIEIACREIYGAWDRLSADTKDGCRKQARLWLKAAAKARVLCLTSKTISADHLTAHELPAVAEQGAYLNDGDMERIAVARGETR